MNTKPILATIPSQLVLPAFSLSRGCGIVFDADRIDRFREGVVNTVRPQEAIRNGVRPASGVNAAHGVVDSRREWVPMPETKAAIQTRPFPVGCRRF